MYLRENCQQDSRDNCNNKSNSFEERSDKAETVDRIYIVYSE